MSVGHDPIADLFAAARELEPRECEVADALTLAMSAPPHSLSRTRIVRLIGFVGAVVAVAIAFAVVEVRAFGAPATKSRHGYIDLVAKARKESSVIDVAAVVSALLARQGRMRPENLTIPSPWRGLTPGPAQATGQSRRVRCECERRAMRPPPRSFAAAHGRPRG